MDPRTGDATSPGFGGTGAGVPEVEAQTDHPIAAVVPSWPPSRWSCSIPCGIPDLDGWQAHSRVATVVNLDAMLGRPLLNVASRKRPWSDAAVDSELEGFG